jgi:hypothetical protein
MQCFDKDKRIMAQLCNGSIAQWENVMKGAGVITINDHD